MYQEYFGLKETAFSIAVNPRYFYMSVQHKEALAHLLYGIQGGGFVMLSGEVGTGKTTIIRCLLDQLPPKTEVAFILNPMANVEDMLSTICEELKLELSEGPHSIKYLMDTLQQKLLDNHAEGKRTVLLIDEAQLLSVDVLEQVRLLTNLETATEKLLQIVLVGQPELDELLSQPRLRQLSQRITARFKLEPLNLAETQRYIQHRLRIAGKKDERSIFSPAVIKRIHSFSGGTPRLINILCERLLIGAYGHNKIEVDNDIFNQALKEVGAAKIEQAPSRALPLSQYGLAAAILCGALVIAFSVIQTPDTPATSVADSSSDNRALTSTTTEKKSQAGHNSQGLSEPFAQNSVQGSASTDFEQRQHSAEKNAEAESSTRQGQISRGAAALVHDSNAASYEFRNRTEAYAQLFQHYGYRGESLSHPCWQTEEHQLSCSVTHLDTWQELRQLNRPAVISLVTEDKRLAYAVVTGLSANQVSVLNHSGEKEQYSLLELGRLWNGAVYYLWRKPDGYEKPLTQGSRSPVVLWVAEQFALLDSQARAITDSYFSKRLETRIKIFQTSEGLKADGIIGEQTLMKLNEKLGLIGTLDLVE
ncbi:AAA family ATPase [Agaribacterium haliotis]|uniref:AAA family ATPase n=1 Tax=Agaribacterium haliotis TaxID=2013869 RepID=UPI000BB58AFD|nr:AAA family ATPase [Agaribacterium haliotis]